MQYAIVYSSQTGNGKLLAETIYEHLGDKDCVYIGGIGALDYKALKAQRIYVGFWTDKGQCDIVTETYLKNLRDKEIFLFGTAGYGGDEYLNNVLKRSEEFIDSSNTVVGSFICQGRMPASVKERYDKLALTNKVPNIDELIANYEAALSHPDENDLKALKAKL